MKIWRSMALYSFWMVLCSLNPKGGAAAESGAAGAPSFYHRRDLMARFEYKLRSKTENNWDDEKLELVDPIADAMKEMLQETYGELVRIESQGSSFYKKGGKATMDIAAFPKTVHDSQKLTKEFRSELYAQIEAIFREVQKTQEDTMICTLTTPPENARDQGDYSYRIYYTGEPPSTLEEISSLYRSGDLSTSRVYYHGNKGLALTILSQAAEKAVKRLGWRFGSSGQRSLTGGDGDSLDVYAHHDYGSPDKVRRLARAAIEQKASEYDWFDVAFHSDLITEHQVVISKE